jgi:hypothetical protein
MMALLAPGDAGEGDDEEQATATARRAVAEHSTSDFWYIKRNLDCESWGPLGEGGFEGPMILRFARADDRFHVLGSSESRRTPPSARRLFQPEETIVLEIMKSGLLCLALCAAATPAQAQMTWTDKGFFNLDGGAQVGSTDFSTTTPFELYGETGSLTAAQDIKGGGFFNVSAGYKVWRNLAIGVGYTFTSSQSDAAVSASVPDPLFFDAHRQVTATASGLKHKEQQIHITGTWMIPVTDKVDVGLSFGPTFFNVTQDLPNGLTVTEPGPTVNSVAVEEIDDSTVGFHLGVDVTYMVTPRFGVGGLARVTRGSVDVERGGQDLKLGGFQIGGGLRVRF